MPNKGTIILAVSLIVILGGVVIYGYLGVKDGDCELEDELAEGVCLVESEPAVDLTPEIQGPSIAVEPAIFDFGTVVYGEVAEQEFSIKNAGTEDLEILRLSTSCGCTKAVIAEADKIIAPGQSVSMLVSFDPAVHEDDSDLGEVIRIVYLKTNDPDNPEIEVEIRAKVIKI